MKLLNSLILFVWVGSISHAQTQALWPKIEVGNNLYVNLPNHPEYIKNGKVGAYVSKSQNCLFMVAVTYDAIPHFEEFLKLSSDEKQKLTNVFLENYIKGKLQYVDSEKTQVISSKVSQYLAKETSYLAINPSTGVRGRRFSKAFLIYNKLYSFECWYLNSTKTAENEKNLFISSISVN